MTRSKDFSWLGDAVSVQVRGADYVAIAATLVPGLLAVADVLLPNITELGRQQVRPYCRRTQPINSQRGHGRPARGLDAGYAARLHPGRILDFVTKRTDDSTGQLRWHYPVPEAGYGFCATCGSSLFWKSTATPHRISICAGTLVQRCSKFGIE